MTDWHDPIWYDYRSHAEDLESTSLHANGLPEAALDGLAASQWIHSLLRTRQELATDSSQREARITQVLERITTEDSRIQRRRASRRIILRAGSLAVAATLVAAVFVLNWKSTPDALAQVERMRQAMRDDKTRQYNVEFELESLVRKRTLQGTLTVRGAKQFVLRCRLPLGGEFLLGADGKTGWGVPPLGPVAVSPDPERLRRWSERFPTQIPPQILQFDTVLSRMTTDYNLTHTASKDKQHAVVIGKKHASAPERLPDEIRLEADSQTGVIQTLSMQWKRDSVLPLPKKITLTFDKTIDVDRKWFHHEQHHDEDRPIIVLDEDSLPSADSP